MNRTLAGWLTLVATGCGAGHDEAPGGSADADPRDGDRSPGDGSPGDIPPGEVLFAESFDDADLAGRGWYDAPGGTITTAEHAPGSAAAFECRFVGGATGCAGGQPARHALTASESVYVSFYIKLSDNWVGSGRAYHPHMMHLISDLDPDYVGPAATHLTAYMELVDGRAMLALQDSLNVDPGCVLRNDDSFVGCNGDFDSYPFTEDRSVCACNGLAGDVDGRDCFSTGAGTWYSARSWRSADPADTTRWRFVEVYYQMNSIVNGVGVPDGQIRWVQDGLTLIQSDAVLMRTGAHPDLRFDQFAFVPYIGDGSPVDQRFWIDELTVATGRP